MTVLFKVKTSNAYAIKILAEFLQHNIKTACFEITQEGIKLCMMDHHRSVLIDLFLFRVNFNLYKFKSSQKMYIGLNLNHFHKMLRSIKKKDCLTLFIKKSQPTELGIKVIPKEHKRVTTSYIKIQQIQNLDINVPTGYDNPIIVPSSEFQKMCKDLLNIGNTITISATKYSINFKCDAGDIIKREVQFGEDYDSDDDSDDCIEEKKYSETFYSEKILRIIKLSGVGSNIQIFTAANKPLMLKTNISSLGNMSVFIKSIKSISQEE